MQMLAMLPMLASATGGAAAGGAAAAGAAGSIGSFMSVLAAGTGIASGLATLAQGRAQATSLESAAKFEDFNGKQELLRGRAEALEVVRQSNDAVAAAQVAGFASGLAGTGSVTTAKQNSLRDAEYQIGMTRDAAMIQAGARRGAASRYRMEAGGVRTGSIFGALGQWGSTLGRFGQTG